VIKVQSDLAREMALLEHVSWLFPEVATVVVAENADESLATVAWDLGAQVVLVPPLPRNALLEVVSGLLTAPAEETAIPLPPEALAPEDPLPQSEL
jgi:hypothetical protein